jgi:hypothetical protein
MQFLYRLALPMGIWNVQEWAEEISWEQTREWMAAWQLMPWGDEWFRDAVLMAQQFNAHRDPKRSSAMEPKDFMPVKEREKSPDELAAKFLTFAAAVNSAKG